MDDRHDRVSQEMTDTAVTIVADLLDAMGALGTGEVHVHRNSNGWTGCVILPTGGQAGRMVAKAETLNAVLGGLSEACVAHSELETDADQLGLPGDLTLGVDGLPVVVAPPS
jgi:hypothetical protein